MKSLKSAVYSHLIDRDRYRLEAVFTEMEPGVQCDIHCNGNESGALYRISAAFFVHGWDIRRGTIQTSHPGYLDDRFTLMRRNPGPSGIDPDEIRNLVGSLDGLLFHGQPVRDALQERGITLQNRPVDGLSIKILDGKGPGIEVHSPYDPVFLLRMFQSFYMMDVDVLEGEISADPHHGVYTLFWMDPSDIRFTSSEFTGRLVEELSQSL